MITIFGRRGIGKSALGAKAVDKLCAEGRVAGVVNLSTRTGGPISVERIFFTYAELAESAVYNALPSLWASRLPTADKLAELFCLVDPPVVEMDGASRPYLIVLDNLEDQLDDEGRPRDQGLLEFFDIVFRAESAPQVLVTSQVPVALDPALRRFEGRVHLDAGLPLSDSVVLLRELDRDGQAGLLDAPTEQLARAALRLHGVPRALELAVGALVEDHLTLPTLEDVLDSFATRDNIVDQLAQDRRRRLRDSERLTLDVLATFRRPATAEAIRWVMRPMVPGVDPRQALARLIQVHLISVDRGNRVFALHPLDADLAYGALPYEGPWSRRTLERRVAAWYARNRRPLPWRSVTDAAVHRLEIEHRVRAGDHDEAAVVLSEIDEFLVWRGSIGEVLEMHSGIGPHLRTDAGRLANLVGIGLVRYVGGPLGEAVAPLEEAVELADRLGDHHQLTRALFALGETYRHLKELDKAVHILARAVANAERTSQDDHLSHGLLCLSLAHSYRAETDRALAVADRMLRAGNEDPLNRARAYDARCAAFAAAGRWTEAIADADRAIDAYTAAEVPEALGYVYNIQGLAFLGMSRYEEAAVRFRGGAEQGARVHIPRVEGLCLFNLAWAQLCRGRYDLAMNSVDRAISALCQSGGTDFAAAQALSAAAIAARADDPIALAAAYRRTAELIVGNGDLVPSTVLNAEADRLSGEAPTP
ncbi:tetratricopeptide repeat protein [Spirillospora sp. CA-294931]|uniref:tetratricopeptide repeat protein n=1 Tax=Spirillospora sp. CA-294931 TaxID=3240042 RepID=UPI003D9457A5